MQYTCKSMIKWIGAIFGYIYFRFAGAIIGYFLGSILENSLQLKGGYYSTGNFRRKFTDDKLQLNLLSLAAIVIKADGKVDDRELNFVRNYFISSYGKMNADMIFSKFNKEVKKDSQDIVNLCDYFVRVAPYEIRLQILHFLFGIANADGRIDVSEVKKIFQISDSLRIKSIDFESIKAMFIKSTDDAYKILEISPDSSDLEVKKAYREMAKKYHPDKIQSNDEALKKGAKEKFQRVQDAYEKIQKKRGF